MNIRTRNERRKSENREIRYWVFFLIAISIFVSFLICAILTGEKFKVQRKGEPVTVEVIEKKERLFVGLFHTSYELDYTYKGKTYSDKVDVNMKVEGLKYRLDVFIKDNYETK
ncbi:hypothetical protein [Bacillus pseudomycoides]|uniref:hypothetical protein n=1 Tax=Bacillus pseudomycoides TaxID=64104 RepID=UPI000BFD8565|nr:hypothetical protein [Bacillus pseudomycoides]PHA80848.1 hypothetical protein COE78_25960 [Bacillus pseudomycoides]PHC68098.1 hypothetical protein COF38_27080 [Bacillus pseudomycoides]